MKVMDRMEEGIPITKTFPNTFSMMTKTTVTAVPKRKRNQLSISIYKRNYKTKS